MNIGLLCVVASIVYGDFVFGSYSCDVVLYVLSSHFAELLN